MLDKFLVKCYSKITSFLRGIFLKGSDTVAKHNDPYWQTKNAWDKRCLITVSTHLKLTDRAFLDDYCKRHNTSPYKLLKSYLLDCVALAKLEAAEQKPLLPA